jgi:hypothetical protein
MAPLDLTDDEDEPVDIRAMKALLRVARPMPGDMSEIDLRTQTIAILPTAVRENLMAILNRLVRDEIAHVERSGAYIVDNVTIAQVEQRLHAALKPRSTRALRYVLEGGGDGAGPRAFYADPIAARTRRRRPSSLERYLAELAPADAGIEGG